jgi:Type I phosphodiesterase / nucleotide pyrophosphatase
MELQSRQVERHADRDRAGLGRSPACRDVGRPGSTAQHRSFAGAERVLLSSRSRPVPLRAGLDPRDDRLRVEDDWLLEPLEVRSPHLRASRYRAYDFTEYPPFFALGPGYRCAIFDVPQARISERVSGIQVQAWGARSARTASCSDPPELLAQLVRAHGGHPAFDRDHASHWNPVAVAWLERALLRGIARRGAICRDLLGRERWDLFFTVFGETHSAGHFFWHLSQDHPLCRRRPAADADPLLRVFQAVDREIGAILAACPGADVLVFSPEGMEANSVDLPSIVFLPELLYRFSFGRHGLTEDGPPNILPPAPMTTPLALGWHRAIYGLRADSHPVRRRLRRWLPMELSHRWEQWSSPGPGPAYPGDFGSLFHQPAVWYTPIGVR